MRMDVICLQSVALLHSLGSEDLDLISRLMDIVDLPGGILLIRENEPGKCLYIILEGEVEIIKSLGTVNERLISRQGPGEVLGEISLIVPD